jgi:hypothetical protein
VYPSLASADEPPYREPQPKSALRLSVRTAAFHVAKRGSIPLGRATLFRIDEIAYSYGTSLWLTQFSPLQIDKRPYREPTSKRSVAGAGFSTSVPNFDRDSVDVTISAAGVMRPRVDIQLKATKNLSLNGNSYSYPLPIKNYSDLRALTQTPRILMVLHMPQDETQWITVTVDELVLRRAAYWVSLQGLPESENETSVTVGIPTVNVFDLEGLKHLMKMSSKGIIK